VSKVGNVEKSLPLSMSLVSFIERQSKRKKQKQKRTSLRHLNGLQDGADANGDVLRCHVLGLQICVGRRVGCRKTQDSHL